MEKWAAAFPRCLGPGPRKPQDGSPLFESLTRRNEKQKWVPVFPAEASCNHMIKNGSRFARSND